MQGQIGVFDSMRKISLRYELQGYRYYRVICKNALCFNFLADLAEAELLCKSL